MTKEQINQQWKALSDKEKQEAQRIYTEIMNELRNK